MWSERTIPSGIAALIVATVPVWMMFLDGLRPGGRAVDGARVDRDAIGLAGVASSSPAPKATSTSGTGWRSSPSRSRPFLDDRLALRAVGDEAPSPRLGRRGRDVAAGAVLALESRVVGDDCAR